MVKVRGSFDKLGNVAYYYLTRGVYSQSSDPVKAVLGPFLCPGMYRESSRPILMIFRAAYCNGQVVPIVHVV